MSPSQEKLKQLCLELFEIDALKFGDFVTKVGIKTPVYLDLRGIISYPKLMDVLASVINNYFTEHKITGQSICGVPYTALPIATAVSIKYDIPMLIRRKDVKTYGTKKLIEGIYQKGDKCIIVEDVVTSGSSILETITDLKSVGIVVTDILTIVDREQGGRQTLKDLGYTLHSLYTLTSIMSILFEANKVKQDVVESVRNYLTDNQVQAKCNNAQEDSRLSSPLESRLSQAKCPLTTDLINIILKKKSNVCIALDVTSSKELLSLAKQLGPHIALLKTHSDAVTDWSEDVANELVRLSKEMEFLILEDRKLADIGATVGHQFSLIAPWAHLVTVHSIAGPGPLQEIARIAEQRGEKRGVFLIAELSCAGNLIDEKYTQATLNLAQSFASITVGLVCQSPSVLSSSSGLLQLTPGIHLSQAGDNKGQQYNSPNEVITLRGADIGVIGRGVTQAPDPLAAVKEYKRLMWEAYEQRLK
uniref:Uridine 5'-monophosphate synthase n=1 Tax=Cacopsylla melanoneura TaxID=428564 RepID=A0A8D8QUL1_9HEMI